MCSSAHPCDLSVFYFMKSVFETALLLDKYYTPLLCLFGALGNSLSLAVFCMDPKYGSQSSSYYLSALAVSDTGFLVNVFAVWLEGVYGGVITSGLSCPLVMYLGQVTCFMSVYLTVAFSIERFVAVHYPFSRPRICTRSKAKKVIAGITLLALLLFSYAWVIAKVIPFPMYQDNELGHHDNISISQLSGSFVEGGTTSASLDAVVLDDTNSWDVPPNPLYMNQKSQSLYFQNDYKIENESFWEAFAEYEDPQTPVYTSNVSGDMTLFALPSSKKNASYSDNKITPTENQPNLNINHHADVHDYNDSSNAGTLPPERCICSVPDIYHKISEIANYIDSVLTLVVPFFLIGFFNLRIALTVWKLKDQRRNIVATATTNGTMASPSLLSRDTYQNYRCNHRPSAVSCSMEDDSVIYAPARSSKRHSQHRNICCLLNVKNKNYTYDGSIKKKRGTPTVRFQDCIEMSQMESTLQGSLSLLASQNNLIQSAITTTSATASSPSSTTRFCVVRRKKSSSSSEVRVTKTLLLVSLVFVLLNLPAHTIRCAQFIQALTGTREGQEILYALQPWANLLFNTNFAINFLLYCVSGRNFRNSLKNIAMRKCQCPKQASKMTPRFSWASDRNNKRCKNPCLPTATASTLVPSTVTLADADSNSTMMSKGKRSDCCRKNYVSSPDSNFQQEQKDGRFCRKTWRRTRYEEDEDEFEEDNEENTTMLVAFYNNETYLNYFDEEGLDGENEEGIAAV